MSETAQSPEPSRQFLKFIQQQASEMRGKDQPPQSLAEWELRKPALRKQLLAAWGGFPAEPCALEPKHLGELKREGYRVEKIVFQTRPGIFMTANAYVPDGEGKRAAVLCVHGHWPGAKQDPVVQSRCIGLVKHGFFVLCVDAFGAGERAVGKALGQYHGEMVAATLYPVGLPLSGLQVYENMRAVDYLLTRPEVDGTKLGITGASGGGNQTMYAGAFDERFRCVVPVCSVGNYQAYLGAACCMCEVVPGALTFTEEAGLLAMVAPRALMVVSATMDAFQFSVGEAKKSLAAATPVFELHGKGSRIKQAIFESPHAYSQPMREAMYGWMALHLRGEGTGEPLPEAKFETEDREALRCFPGETRPDDFVTIPQFAAAEGRKLLMHRQTPDHLEHWEAAAEALRHNLKQTVFGGFPARGPLNLKVEKNAENASQVLTFEPEPGIALSAMLIPGDGKSDRWALILDLDGVEQANQHELTVAAKAAGWGLITCDLRATGKLAVTGDHVMRAPDHNSAEWSLWTGRPLLGQWTWDVTRLIDALAEAQQLPATGLTVIGLGPAALVATCAGICDSRVQQLALAGGLLSYINPVPYEKQRLGLMAPRMLADVGDIRHLLALLAPRKVIVTQPVLGSGDPCSADVLAETFAYPRKIFGLLKAEQRFTAHVEPNTAEVVKFLGT